jgi:hypothetical protein
VQNLRERVTELIPGKQKELKEVLAKYADKSLGQVTVSQVRIREHAMCMCKADIRVATGVSGDVLLCRPFMVLAMSSAWFGRRPCSIPTRLVFHSVVPNI